MISRWELIEENKSVIRSTVNPIFGEIDRCVVLVDVYRRINWRGIYKYKYVERGTR